jgi:hypothetical protein
MLNVASIEGTVIGQRIIEISKQSHSEQRRYGLKSNQTLNRNLSMYTEE